MSGMCSNGYVTFNEVISFVKDGYVSVCDEDNDLKLFCYENINWDSEENLRRVRGLVYQDDKLISRTFGGTLEYTVNDDISMESHRNAISEFLEDPNVFYSEEGTLVRIFYHNNKWYLSTHKKLDARQSRWGNSKTFGELFTQGIYNSYMWSIPFREFLNIPEQKDEDEDIENVIYDSFLQKLSKDKTYIFLIKSTTQNRIVCTKVSEIGVLLYLGRIDNNSQKYEGVSDLDSYINISKRVEKSGERYTVDELIEKTKEIDHTEHQGIIIFTSDFSRSIKLINKKYSRGLYLRGNCPSVKFRYLELLNKDNINEISEYIILYPEYTLDFVMIESIMFNIAKACHKIYLSRHIGKQYITTEPELHIIVKNAHSHYLQNRVPTTPEIIRSLIVKMTPVFLNRLIKKFKDFK
jgi:hypothetical protein